MGTPESAAMPSWHRDVSIAAAPPFWFWVSDLGSLNFEYGGAILARERLLALDVVNTRGGCVVIPS